jgi:biotin synthase
LNEISENGIMTRHKAFLEMAEDIAAGGALPSEGLEEIAALSDNDVFEALAGADLIRNAFFGREIHLCAIHNGKSGRCTEDCSFCSQSMYAKTDIPVYPLQGSHELIARGMRAARTAINRYSVVTSGKGLTPSEVKAVANALSALNGSGIQTCASLGILAEHDMQVLKAAGVGRYHHNLETSRVISGICVPLIPMKKGSGRSTPPRRPACPCVRAGYSASGRARSRY